MPTRMNTNFPRPTDPSEFESLVCDICAREWGDPSTKKFGRSGQKQYGVDVYGHPGEDPETYYGAQCKLRTQNDQLSKKEIEKEVAEAKKFPHKLDKLIVVTDAPRDANTQMTVDEINEKEVKSGNFQVVIWFWDDVTERISVYQNLIVKYYKDFYANLTSLSIVERMVDEPLQVFIETIPKSKNTFTIEDLLQFRGIRILTAQNTPPKRQKYILGNGYLDGFIIVIDSQEEESSGSTLQKSFGVIQAATRQLDEACPIFIIVGHHLHTRLQELLDTTATDLQRVHLITSNVPVAEVAENIFKSVFSYGFSRRGGIRTIEICTRSHEGKPSSTFLDMDWHSRLTTKIFPDTKEWDELFVPAITSVKSQLLLQGDVTLIQVNSQLPIPGAVALGFHLSVREIRVGVWARKTGASDFKEQFWLSDSPPAKIDFNPVWYKNDPVTSQSSIIEVTSYVSIHNTVESFVDQSNILVDKWLSIRLEVDGVSPKNINEGQAVAFANQIAQQVRLLNGQGITEVHLFCRVPSAMGVLIGQRLHACGRILLYWFENPGYRYAFSLS